MRLNVKLRKNDFLGAIILLYFIAFIQLTSSKTTRLLQKEVCTTKACTDLGSTLLKSMNQSVDPCDDFYQFACGTFAKTAVIPDHKVMVNFITDLDDVVRSRLKYSIENEITNKDPQTFKKVKQFYEACMNEEEIEKNGKTEFLKVTERLGGWPLLVGDTWDETNFDWLDSMYKFREEGYSSECFINFGVFNDLKNNTRNLIYLDQVSLGLPQRILSNDTDNSFVKAYYHLMYKISQLFDADHNIAERDLYDVLQFEIALSKISLLTTRYHDIDNLYNPMTVKELKKKYPKLPIVAHLNRLMAPKDKLLDNDVIVVADLGYYEKLPALLAKTPKRVLANYVFWQAVQSSISQLGAKFMDVYRDYSSLLTGIKTKSDRWITCVKQADTVLYLGTGALYVRKHFDKVTKDRVLQMVENLRTTFRHMLTDISWMDEHTRKTAIKKLDKILPLVAYPDELLNDKALDDYYDNLRVEPNNYFKNIRNLHSFFASKTFEDLRKPIDKADWTGLWGAASVVNAFYSAVSNTINFPSGILQESFFNKDLPNYANYGRLGSIIGHELTHGFDNKGRLFDEYGRKIDWWSLKTKKEFLKRADCVIKQYSNYTIKDIGLHLNGNITQGENIADIGGLVEAYLAYDLYLNGKKEEPRLPGLEKFTPRQTFWLANANLWCVKYRPEFLQNVVVLDSHTPNEYRVIGMFSNSEEFAKDFNCPVGSKMNPPNKCAFWR